MGGLSLLVFRPKTLLVINTNIAGRGTTHKYAFGFAQLLIEEFFPLHILVVFGGKGRKVMVQHGTQLGA